MKNKFKKSWKSSKQRRKQRKYLANAPIHIKKRTVNANVSKDLRKKYGKRSIPLKKGDTIKIMRGKFKGKEGKITRVRPRISGIEVEGIQRKKHDGSKVSVKLQPSNVQIIEFNLEDSRRSKFLKSSSKEEKKEKTEKSKSKSVEIKNAP